MATNTLGQPHKSAKATTNKQELSFHAASFLEESRFAFSQNVRQHILGMNFSWAAIEKCKVCSCRCRCTAGPWEPRRWRHMSRRWQCRADRALCRAVWRPLLTLSQTQSSSDPDLRAHILPPVINMWFAKVNTWTKCEIRRKKIEGISSKGTWWIQEPPQWFSTWTRR